MTKRVLRFLLCAALLSSLQLFAQEHYTEGGYGRSQPFT
jgi:hypothetical protein